jgi:glycosyltransferase involved in cell wall biosynthesis
VGGIEQSIRQICKSLRGQGYEVDIAIPIKLNAEAPAELDGARIIRLSSLGYWRHPYQKYHAVIITNFSLLPHLVVLASLTFLKNRRNRHDSVILVPHGGMTVSWNDFTPLKAIVKRLSNSLLGFPLVKLNVSKVIAVSNWERNALEKISLGKEILVIRNGVDFPPSSIQSEEKEKYFIFVGRIHPIKNLEGIIDTFSVIHGSPGFWSYKLYIVGDYNADKEYFRKLQKLIQNHGLLNDVVFCGEVVGEEKLILIARAAALFCLSHYESDSLVIKEAFSLRTKVIINTNYALGDYTKEENAFISDEVIDTENLRKFLAAKFSNHFQNPLINWEQVADAYRSVF